MMNLDIADEFKKYDTGKVMESVRLLGDQVDQAWREVKDFSLPEQCLSARQIIVCGMGGSALGGRIVDALYSQQLRVPLEVYNEYFIPSYAGNETLAIISSYSGNTEETISAANIALKKGVQIFGITTGGSLGEFLKINSLPGYVFNPSNNPSGQPRMALGYAIGALMGILRGCGFISVQEGEMDNAIKAMRRLIMNFGPDVVLEANIAKKIAVELKNKFPILVASEHLSGVSYAFKNQLNETSKTFCAMFELPEMNHHLMEGLRNPAHMKGFLRFILFESELYSDRIKKRYTVTADVLDKNEVESLVYRASCETRLEQVFEVLALGSWVQFYLAMLYEIDPAGVPWVDYFKKKLANG